ncbi:MAG: aminotransferase class I/II-fold pyridoxal phosphate-dependent enzyme [Saccharospirillaceae bacterium]|nr:aminotransferase class I/II-fold pyridoxal phosphate-dependent enzyme [Pseudomonadales bacterium]NRB79354.1 aminotransferase class I/II-fold pyridoxal phosphate-dependent enzyme [Saccharospirillaceae bacterium]
MFNKSLNRKDNHSIKFNTFDESLLPMWIADMDFEAPQCIKSALIERLQQADLGYTKSGPGLDQSIVDWCKTQYDWDIQANWIAWLPGIVSGFNMACQGFNKGKVVVQTPNYPPMLQAPKQSGQKNLELSVTFDESTKRWMFDFEQLEILLSDEQCGLFLLCNPMNPQGTMLTQQELKHIIKLCHKHNVQLCSDEIHCDLRFELPHFPAGKFDPKAITLMAASKTFNIAGLGCSFAIIEDSFIRKHFVKQMNGLVSFPSNLGLVATQSAFEHGDSWRLELMDYLKINRDTLVSALNDFKINNQRIFKTHYNDASFLCWIDCTQLELITQQSALDWFKSAGIIPSDGIHFGKQGFVRINFGCPLALVKQALNLIKQKISTNNN